MIGVIELTARTVAPTELSQGQVLMDGDGKPFAVVSSNPDVSADGSVVVSTAEIPVGPFDVRTFSNDHRYMRTQGCAGIVTWQTYPQATAYGARLMRNRTDEECIVWRQYSALYHAETGHLVRIVDMVPDLPVHFPVGTTADIAWMGE